MANKWVGGLKNVKGVDPIGGKTKDKPAASPIADWLKKLYNTYQKNKQPNYLTSGTMQTNPMYEAGKPIGKGIQQAVTKLSTVSPQQQQRMEAIREKQRQDALKVYNTGIAPANQYDLSGLTPEQRIAFSRAPGFGLTLRKVYQDQVYGVDKTREPILSGGYGNPTPTLGANTSSGAGGAGAGDRYDQMNGGVGGAPADPTLFGYRHGSDYDPWENYRGYQPPGILPPSPGLTPPPPNEIPTYEYPWYSLSSNGGGYGGQQRPDVNQWYANMVNWTINRPQGG